MEALHSSKVLGLQLGIEADLRTAGTRRGPVRQPETRKVPASYLEPDFRTDPARSGKAETALVTILGKLGPGILGKLGPAILEEGSGHKRRPIPRLRAESEVPEPPAALPLDPMVGNLM